jgi:hypothetical protein
MKEKRRERIIKSFILSKKSQRVEDEETTVQVRFFRFENTVRLAKCLKMYDLKKRYY